MRGQYNRKSVQNAAERGELPDDDSTGKGDATQDQESGPNVLALRDFAEIRPQDAERCESEKERMGEDSNPRWTFAHCGFQDRRLRPLGHPSGTIFYRVFLMFAACLSLG